jgi:hypothetical protein
LPPWKDRPNWYLVAEQVRTLMQENQRFMAQRMKARERANPVDHGPLVTAPAVVVNIIREAPAAVAGT